MGTTSYPGRIAAKEFPFARVPPSGLVRLGNFEFKADTGEIWENGNLKKLQHKPLQILLTLLEQPGELVTRDELVRRMWPDGTYVDFESGLNTAVNRLRAALGDSTETPQFVETLPRLGYRLICTVEQISLPPAPDTSSMTPAVGNQKRWASSGFSPAVPVIAVSFVILALLFFWSRPKLSAPLPTFRQLTFQSGFITSALFVPGSDQITYTAAWGYGSRKTYLLNLKNGSSHESADSKPVSDVQARVYRQEMETVVEFPAGYAAYKSKGRITDIRVSALGTRAAFLEHPVRDDDGGYLQILNKDGRTERWTRLWSSVAGLAWSPDGKEVWFTASTEGVNRALYASSGPGKVRLISQSPDSLRLLDISAKGEVLVALDDVRMNLHLALPGAVTERDLSKFDGSHVDDISPDGRFLLFTESSSVTGKHYSSYLYDLNSNTTKRLSSGRGLALSRDAERVITIDPEDRRSLTILPRDGGKEQVVYGNGFEYQWAKFLSDTGELIVGGSYPGKPLMIAQQSFPGGALHSITGMPYMDGVVISSDGNLLAAIHNGQTSIFKISRSKALSLLPAGLNIMPVAWSSDNRYLYGVQTNGRSNELSKVDVGINKIEQWRSIPTGGIAGFAGLASVAAAPQAEIYAYSTHVILSKLYLVDNWR